MRSEDRPHVLEHPVRCEDCANGVRSRERCRFDLLHRWPGVKPIGCLYYVRRVDG